MVDHLLLVERGADLGLSVGILAQHVEHLLRLIAVAHGFGAQGIAHFLVGNLDIGAPADLGQDQTQPHPPLGDLVIFGA